MLHEFITDHRSELVKRCRARIATRPAPRPTDTELEFGVPLFLDQLAEALRVAYRTQQIAETATRHGSELLDHGFSIAQVVHDYGGVCQSITELAVETGAPITTSEFQTLNGCLDEAIAEAVTEYGRLRAHEGTERLGRLAHELRNVLNTATLSFDAIRSGRVGPDGSTAHILERSLASLRTLVDRELAAVRLGAGVTHRERIVVCEFIEDLEVAATMEATAHGVLLSVPSVERAIVVYGDRQILASVVGNLLQNAFKFTRAGGTVALRVRVDGDRVSFDVEDECGGLPPGRVDQLFAPFEQRGVDRSGLGLGLAICVSGARANQGELRVVDRPGHGCVFTVELPCPPLRS